MGHAKLIGKAFVPSGDPTKTCERLLSKLREGGLHVVEVGELEGYARSEGGHGPKWVNAVLTRALALSLQGNLCLNSWPLLAMWSYEFQC